MLPALWAQRQASVSFDVNGNRLPGPVWSTAKTAAGEQRVLTTSSLNGRETPVESIEDRLVTKTDSSEVVERSVVRYDGGGNPLPPERVRIEQTKAADGSRKIVTTTWQTDLNGASQLIERRSEYTAASGSGTAVVERAGQGGALEAIARIERTASPGRAEQREFRKDVNGGFFEAQRELTVTTTLGNRTVADSTRYERIAGGEFEPATRTVTRSVENGGEKTQEIDVYTRFGAQATGEPRLEQQIRQQERELAGGITVRVTGIRREPGSAFETVEETRIEPRRK